MRGPLILGVIIMTLHHAEAALKVNIAKTIKTFVGFAPDRVDLASRIGFHGLNGVESDRRMEITRGRVKERLQQTYGGLEVVGGGITADYDPKGGYNGDVDGSMYSSLEEDIPDPAACSREYDEVVNVSVDAAGTNFSDITNLDVKKNIIVLNDTAYLTYEVSFFYLEGNNPMKPCYFIDACNLTVVYMFNSIRNIFGKNPFVEYTSFPIVSSASSTQSTAYSTGTSGTDTAAPLGTGTTTTHDTSGTDQRTHQGTKDTDTTSPHGSIGTSSHGITRTTPHSIDGTDQNTPDGTDEMTPDGIDGTDETTPDGTDETTPDGIDDTDETTPDGIDGTDQTTPDGIDGTDHTTPGGTDDTDETTPDGIDGTDQTTPDGIDKSYQDVTDGTDQSTDQNTPDGTDETTPDGTDDTDETTPDGTDGTDEMTPDGIDGTDQTTPDGTDETTPDGIDETTPDGTDGTDEMTPDGIDGTDQTIPDGTDETTPDGTDETTPDGTDDTDQTTPGGTHEMTPDGIDGTDQTTPDGIDGTDEMTPDGIDGTDQTIPDGTDETTPDGTDESYQDVTDGTDQSTPDATDDTDETTPDGTDGTDDTDETTPDGIDDTDETTPDGIDGTDQTTPYGADETTPPGTSESTTQPSDVDSDIQGARFIRKRRCSGPARGKGGNRKIGSHSFDREPFCLDIISSGKTCILTNKYLRVVDLKYSKRASGGITARFTCSRGYRDAINGAYSPAMDALYYGTAVSRLFKEWYGITPLKIRPTFYVHYGKKMQSAYFDGRNMVFGDGKDFFYPLVALDVVAHEYGHGVISSYSNLIYDGQAGAIEESFADITGEVAKYFTRGTNDWKVAADIVKHKNMALRYFSDPTKDGLSVKHVRDFDKDYVHFSAGIFNYAFYHMVKVKRLHIKKAYRCFLTANRTYWGRKPTFDEAACGVVKACKDHRYNYGLVKRSFMKVGISFRRCRV